MASAKLSRRVRKVVGYPPLAEMSDLQRREFYEALLDAVAASSGTRASVTDKLLRVRARGAILGRFGFDAKGDATSSAVTMYRIENGRKQVHPAAAEAFAPTIAVVPGDELPPAGRAYVEEFEQRFSARPCCFAVHLAQVTHMVLDAIADSDGSRAQVLGNLFEAHVEDGLVGDFDIDGYGDTTLTTIGVYQIQGGRLRFQTAITPPAELLARR
jgi:hypothetical protein